MTEPSILAQLAPILGVVALWAFAEFCNIKPGGRDE